MSLGKKKTFEPCLKSHTFKIIMNPWDSPCWKNEGSLYTFYVQFILISFLGRLFNLQSREKKLVYIQTDMVLSCCFIFIYCKVSYVYHRRGRSHRDEIVQHPQSQGAVRLQRAHHFISLWQHRKTGDYKGMKFRGCQTPPAVLQYSEAQHLVSFYCNCKKAHCRTTHRLLVCSTWATVW